MRCKQHSETALEHNKTMNINTKIDSYMLGLGLGIVVITVFHSVAERNIGGRERW